MIFKGIAKTFSLEKEGQYDTIGAFWEEMALLYGLENLQGLGYGWANNRLSYAIGLKDGDIPHYDTVISLPEDGWQQAMGETDRLKQIYDRIYQDGPLAYEIEEFFENGTCVISYRR